MRLYVHTVNTMLSHDPRGAVVAWRNDPGEFEQVWDDAGNPAGQNVIRPPSIQLAGYADPIVAAQLIEEAQTTEGLVWLGFGDTPAVDNLRAVWAKDIMYATTNDNGSQGALPGV